MELIPIDKELVAFKEHLNIDDSAESVPCVAL